MLEINFITKTIKNSGEFIAVQIDGNSYLFQLTKYSLLQKLKGPHRSFIDVSVLYNSDTQKIVVSRGPNPSPQIFFQFLNRVLRITSSPDSYLSNISISAISRGGLFDFLAHSLIVGVNDAKFTPFSVLSAWEGIADQTRVTFEENRLVANHSVYDTIWSKYTPHIEKPDDLVYKCRNAATKYIAALSAVGCLSSEISGGIDSGIVSMLAKKTRNFRGAITIPYPFREFERERKYRSLVTDYLDRQILELNWRECLPFSHSDAATCGPTLAAGSLKFFQLSLEASRSLNASIHLTGHGGDRLFRVDPNARLPAPKLNKIPSWSGKSFVETLEASINSTLRAFNKRESENALSWNPSLFHVGPQEFNFEHSIYISGLISPALIYALRDLHLVHPLLQSDLQKPLAAKIFGDLLPPAVFTRPGKVDHLGTVVRGAIVNREEILNRIKTGGIILDLLAIDNRAFINYAEEICSGRREAEWFFSAIMAILVWYTNALRFISVS